MARTRAVPRRRPNINFDNRRVAAAKEMRRRVRASDVKIKFLRVRRVAKHSAKKRNVRYG